MKVRHVETLKFCNSVRARLGLPQLSGLVPGSCPITATIKCGSLSTVVHVGDKELVVSKSLAGLIDQRPLPAKVQRFRNGLKKGAYPELIG